jgi:thiol-disulfide isomerase/thioredoxin
MFTMKSLFLPLLLSSSLIGMGQGYHIQVTYQPVENGYLYLGYYFGDKKYVQDSARLSPEGTAVFQGAEPLTGGLYLIVDPNKQRFFDILIDKEQHFKVRIDPASFSIASLTGSEANAYLEEYKKATASMFANFQNWQDELTAAKTKKDSNLVQQKINAATNMAQQWRDSFTIIHPNSYLALLFRLMKEPVYRVKPGASKEDSVVAYTTYKKEYWDNISLSDDRLLRTPMFEQRLSRYMEQVVARNPDSLKRETDKFILYSRSSQTMFRYYINRFTNDYMNPKYMGLDVVFLNLFEKYYLTNQVDWLSAKDKELVFNRAYSIMGNQLGEPAADLNLLDTTDKKVNLYGLQAPYTLVVFWDPDCSHCREQVPIIDSLYKTQWKQLGMKLVGVLVDTIRTNETKWPEVKAKWTNYIQEHGLSNWNHWYQSFALRQEERKKNLPNFRQSYDVFQTPTIYLLDKDKRIVAKKITPEQVNDFLRYQQSNPKTNHP